jgi:AbrB family looped-hinge helix DNA binding protein
MKSKVSVRGQTVIPKEIREALGIKPNTKLYWKLQDGVATVRPLPDDPVAASIGILKGKFSFEDFLRERNEERARERELEERDMRS